MHLKRICNYVFGTPLWLFGMLIFYIAAHIGGDEVSKLILKSVRDHLSKHGL